MGQQIAAGALPVQYAAHPVRHQRPGRPDFVPVGLSLGEAEPETVEVSVVLFSRLITSPVAVILAYLASFAI